MAIPTAKMAWITSDDDARGRRGTGVTCRKDALGQGGRGVEGASGKDAEHDEAREAPLEAYALLVPGECSRPRRRGEGRNCEATQVAGATAVKRTRELKISWTMDSEGCAV